MSVFLKIPARNFVIINNSYLNTCTRLCSEFFWISFSFTLINFKKIMPNFKNMVCMILELLFSLWRSKSINFPNVSISLGSDIPDVNHNLCIICQKRKGMKNEILSECFNDDRLKLLSAATQRKNAPKMVGNSTANEWSTPCTQLP